MADSYHATRTRDAALNAHSVRMTQIAVLHNTGQITDSQRDERVRRSWDMVVAAAIHYGFQV
jgi:hypothetical protein